MAANVDIKALLEAGAHFGHKTSRWHPKMAPFIHSKRGDIHIINLEKTVEQLEVAMQFAKEVVDKGQQILFVGTKRQAKDIVKAVAEAVGQPYVTERWLGGTLTNSTTINGRIKKLKDLESKMASGELANKYNKLEVQRFQEQIDAMNIIFGGIKEMSSKLGALYVTDAIEEATAIKEANRLGVPVIAIVDTNADPSKVTYPIAANDDAIKTIDLITNYMKEAIETAKSARVKKVEDKVEDK
jgi:small subunit ribosomal protein S2